MADLKKQYTRGQLTPAFKDHFLDFHRVVFEDRIDFIKSKTMDM